jgi:hypothetical protein
MRRQVAVFLWMFATLIASGAASADVAQFQNDKEGWVDAVGEFTTIDFTGFPEFTWITDQYAHLGAHFVDGADQIQHYEEGYPEDGWGIDGNAEVRITFDEHIHAIAVDFPGTLTFQLYDDGVLIFTSDWFGGTNPGHFGGVISDDGFDEVRITDPIGGNVNIDDIHFGPPIPAPGSIVGVAALALLARRRQRT